MSTDLALPEVKQPGAIQLLIDLEAAGAIDAVSLTLTDPDMSYDQWESLGRFFGRVGRSYQWYVGDWLNFGEAVFGEAASQGIEATSQERYSEAERVTGLAHGTLMNIRSVCGKVAKARRREELTFEHHTVVASLSPEEQTDWLALAVRNKWGRAELREAIREAKNPDVEDEGEEGGDDAPPPQSKGDRAVELLTLLDSQAQVNSDGDLVVPAEIAAQVRAFLGRD